MPQLPIDVIDKAHTDLHAGRTTWKTAIGRVMAVAGLSRLGAIVILIKPTTPSRRHQTTTDTTAKEPPVETMTVTVRDRGSESPWGSGLTSPITRKVTISVLCPKCGGRRGTPRGLNTCEDGAYFWVETWRNPCGHVDQYADVIKEADSLVTV